MATLIPSIGACVSRMTSGEKRVAERLEQKLDDDYLNWYDVPMGPRNSHEEALHHRKLLFNLRRRSSDYNPGADNLQIMTMKVSKGLEFPVVALPEVQPMPVGSSQARLRNSIKAGGPP